MRRAQRRAPQAAVGREVGRRTRTSPAPWRCRRAAAVLSPSRPPSIGRRGASATVDRAHRRRLRRRGRATRDPLHRLDDPSVARCSGRCCRTAPRGSRSRSAPASRSSRACAAMIRPGVQKPHCTAPASTNACCTSVGEPTGAMPSTVTIVLTDRRCRQHEAAAHQLVVDQHAARAALALLARTLAADQPEPLAQHVRAGSRRSTRRGPRGRRR